MPPLPKQTVQAQGTPTSSQPTFELFRIPMRHDLEPGLVYRREGWELEPELAQQHHVPRVCLGKPAKGAGGWCSREVYDVGEPEEEIQVVAAHREHFLGGGRASREELRCDRHQGIGHNLTAPLHPPSERGRPLLVPLAAVRWLWNQRRHLGQRCPEVTPRPRACCWRRHAPVAAGVRRWHRCRLEHRPGAPPDQVRKVRRGLACAGPGN